MSVGTKLELIADAVYEKGKQAEWSEFWDSAQGNGGRTQYLRAFGGGLWTDENLRPKYDVRPTNAWQMFQYNYKTSDVQACFEKTGAVLDFSNCTDFDMMISESYITRFGVVDTRSASTLSGIFNNGTKLQTVDLLILKDDASQTQGTNRPFAKCNMLQNIKVQGKFGFTFSMEWCPLSKASIISVVNALTENASIASGKKLTLKSSAVTNAFGSTTAQEWTNLITPKQQAGWTITLV